MRNAFVNGGLIDFEFDDDCMFNSYAQLEKLYFEAIKRNAVNRTITIKLYIDNDGDFCILNEVVKWIKKQ